VNIKLLIGIINRPWFIEPSAAMEYAGIAADLIRTGSMPGGDKRNFYSDRFGLDLGPAFRVNDKGDMVKDGPVQVFKINYPIAKYDYCGDPGTQTMQQLIASADSDPTVKSIVLWLDSPGGQVDGTEALANTVKAVKKPVVAYTDGLLASAAYWIGSSANEIISQGSNNGWNETIGSIGTMAMWKDESGKYEKEGIKVHTVFATDSTDKWGNYFAAQKGDYTRLKQELDGLNNTFLDAVKSNRQGKINLDKENVLTGKTYNTKEALKYGLIDRIGNFQSAIKRSLSLSKKQELNTMAFDKTLAVAKAESFSVIAEGDTMQQGGFLISEEALNNIEAHVITAEESVSTLTGEKEALQNEIATLKANASDAAEKEAKIQELNAQIATLKKGAAATSETGRTGEENPAGGNASISFETSYDKEAKELKAKML